MKKFIFIIVFLTTLSISGKNIEGVYSNYTNITNFYKYSQTDFIYKINENIFTYDKFSYKLLNQIILKNKNGYIANSMINDFHKGLFRKITKMKTHNYLEDYMKLYSFIVLDDTLNVNLMIKKLEEYNKNEIDSILFIIKSANLIKKHKYIDAYELIKNYDDDFSNYIKGIYYIKTHKEDRAIQILEKIENKRLWEDTYILISKLLIEKKQYNKALSYIEHFDKYFKQSKNYYNNLYLKGIVYYNKGYFKKSIKVLREVTLKSRNSKIKGNAYYLIGKDYFMLGDYDQMEKYLSYVKNPLIKSDYKKNALFLDGKGMFFKKEYKKAINKFLNFIKEYPSDFLTPYACQLLAESYFNINDYNNAIFYMNKIDKPIFLKKKLIYLKYFIDYKKGLFSDSINAYINFLKNETDNPLRKEIYDYIFINSDNDSIKNELLKRYINEFPDNKETIDYLKQLIPYLIFEELEKDIYFYSDKIMEIFKKQKDEIFTLFINKMIEMKMYSLTVEYYTKYAEYFNKEDSQIMYKISKILLSENNENGSEILLRNIIDKFTDEYSDSSYVILSELYLKDNNIKELKLLYENYRILSRDIFIEAKLLFNIGMYYKNTENYENAINIFLESAQTFGEYRNNAAKSLIEASYCAYLSNDKEYANILLEKAELLATDIELINIIRLNRDKYNE